MTQKEGVKLIKPIPQRSTASNPIAGHMNASLNSLAANQHIGGGINSMTEGSTNMANLVIPNNLLYLLSQQNMTFGPGNGK
jgi:hypothetical protein